MHIDVIQDALRLTVDQHIARQPLDVTLLQQLLLPGAFVRELFASGRVQVGAQTGAPGQTVQAGQQVWLHGGVEEQESLVDVTGVAPLELDVLYEDDHALVINKPASLLVYPGSAVDHDTLAHRVAAYYLQTGQRRRVRHVHRLDRETSGAILYAKHEYAARTFDALLRAHRVTRHYLALAQGRLPQRAGTVERSIGRDRHVSGRYRVSPTGKPARTNYRVVEQAEQAGETVSLVECVLETGRTHQIRVHLAALGCPVVGDAVYGRPAQADLSREGGTTAGRETIASGQALHAWRLEFWHPYREAHIRVVAPPPQDLVTLLTTLGLNGAWDRVYRAQGVDSL